MRRLAHAGVVACVAIAVAFGIAYFIPTVDRLGETADRNASSNFDDREFGGGNSLVVDKSALYEARAVIPEDGSYRLLAGPNVEGATDLTEPYIDQFARSFLMPRRPSADAAWIICYGCDPAGIEEPVEVVWDNGAGISIHEVTG